MNGLNGYLQEVKRMKSEFYRPRRCYEYADGTKAWTKCNKDGEPISTAIYTVGRKAGRMIAFLEAVD